MHKRTNGCGVKELLTGSCTSTWEPTSSSLVCPLASGLESSGAVELDVLTLAVRGRGCAEEVRDVGEAGALRLTTMTVASPKERRIFTGRKERQEPATYKVERVCK